MCFFSRSIPNHFFQVFMFLFLFLSESTEVFPFWLKSFLKPFSIVVFALIAFQSHVSTYTKVCNEHQNNNNSNQPNGVDTLACSDWLQSSIDLLFFSSVVCCKRLISMLLKYFCCDVQMILAANIHAHKRSRLNFNDTNFLWMRTFFFVPHFLRLNFILFAPYFRMVCISVSPFVVAAQHHFKSKLWKSISLIFTWRTNGNTFFYHWTAIHKFTPFFKEISLKMIYTCYCDGIWRYDLCVAKIVHSCSKFTKYYIRFIWLNSNDFIFLFWLTPISGKLEG